MSDLIGFPPGKTKADYFRINGGYPPYGEWTWPDDFAEEQRALFWSAAGKASGHSREEQAIYHQVSQFNQGGGYGKAGMTTVEAFESAAEMYQPTIGEPEVTTEGADEPEPEWQENPAYETPVPPWQDNPVYQPPEPEWQDNPAYEPEPQRQENPVYEAPRDDQT